MLCQVRAWTMHRREVSANEPAPPGSKDAWPTVCVVMPAYRSAGTLLRAVQSVLRQDYQDFVLGISVMPGDSETVEVASSIGDPRVRLVYRSEVGISHARNSVVRAIRAPLYMFLDTDDAYYDGRVIGSFVSDYRSTPGPALRYGDWIELSPLNGAQRRKSIGEYGARAYRHLYPAPRIGHRSHRPQRSEKRLRPNG